MRRTWTVVAALAGLAGALALELSGSQAPHPPAAPPARAAAPSPAAAPPRAAAPSPAAAPPRAEVPSAPEAPPPPARAGHAPPPPTAAPAASEQAALEGDIDALRSQNRQTARRLAREGLDELAVAQGVDPDRLAWMLDRLPGNGQDER